MPEASGAERPLLDELAEADARGAIAGIYAAIRELSAVPMVALIYRHLATMPGTLPWAWSLLGPAMRAGEVQRCAWTLAELAAPDDVPRLTHAALRAVGLGDAACRAIVDVLDAYNRANPVNIVALRCIAHRLRAEDDDAAGASGAAPSVSAGDAPLSAWSPPAALPALPAMIAPAAMSGDVRALVAVLTDRGRADAPSPLVPSLYRHLAHWPPMLALATAIVPPRYGEIDRAAARMRDAIEPAAARLAGRMRADPALPAPHAHARTALVEAIDRFTARIPEMVAIGALLRRSMPADVAERAGARCP